jgi:hypothetical protein
VALKMVGSCSSADLITCARRVAEARVDLERRKPGCSATNAARCPRRKSAKKALDAVRMGGFTDGDATLWEFGRTKPNN